MKTIELRYGVSFGTGDGSDWIEFDYNIDWEAEKAYDLAVETGTPLDSVPELEGVLAAAYKETEEEEIIEEEVIEEEELEELSLSFEEVDELSPSSFELSL